MRKKILAFALSALAAAVLPIKSHAQASDFPTKPVTMVVPYAPGGSTDVLARVLAESMTKNLKQQVLVENVGGAGGTLGTSKVVKAANNGYTLLFHNMGHAASRALYKNLPYNPQTDLEPIGLVADVPMILVSRKDFPAKNLNEVIAQARANKGKVTIAHSGAGSTAHLCAMLFQRTVDVEMTDVPYRGTGPALQDMLANQVDLICDQPVSTTPHIVSGNLRGHALANKARLSTLPDVPTFAEAGLPKFELAVWHGLYAPKGTPPAIIERVNKSLQEALRDPNVVQRFAQLGTGPVEPQRVTPEALRAHVKAEMDRWEPLIKKAGIQLD